MNRRNAIKTALLAVGSLFFRNKVEAAPLQFYKPHPKYPLPTKVMTIEQFAAVYNRNLRQMTFVYDKP